MVVPMWVGQQSVGGWSFMSYCRNPIFFGTAACNQVPDATATMHGVSIVMRTLIRVDWADNAGPVLRSAIHHKDGGSTLLAARHHAPVPAYICQCATIIASQ